MDEQIMEALKGIRSENDKVRAKHFNFLLPLSEKQPELLYQYWNEFVTMLRKPEVSNKYYAIHLIPNLLPVDKEDQFGRIFDEFYLLLNDESPVVANHTADKSAKIIKFKPQYEIKIVDLLLQIDKTSKCRHLELQKAYIIKTFDEAFDQISKKEEVIKFVTDLMKSTSPKTKKAAKAFLAQMGK